MRATDEIFDSRVEAIDSAVDGLSEFSDFPPEILRRLRPMASLAEALQQTAIGTRSGKAPALVGRFAIRNDLIEPLKAFLMLIKGMSEVIVGVCDAKSLTGAAGVASGLSNLYELYSIITNNGFFLTAEELIVIDILRQCRVATTAQIRDRLGDQLDGVDLDDLLSTFSRIKEPHRGFLVKNSQAEWEIEEL